MPYNGHRLTSFPNDQSKHIDYVIAYKVLDEHHKKKDVVEKTRAEFFAKLAAETFEVYTLEWAKDGTKHAFALLHCPTERLLQEAEHIRLEMRLKQFDICEKQTLVRRATLQQAIGRMTQLPLKKDSHGPIMSACFELSMRFLFYRVDDSKHPEGPFSNTLRIFLTDNILTNLTFLNEHAKKKKFHNITKMLGSHHNLQQHQDETHEDEESATHEQTVSSQRGLPFMLSEGYFESAFVLHDESKHHLHVQQLHDFIEDQEKSDLDERMHHALYAKSAGRADISTFMSADTDDTYIDSRWVLNNKWASFRNLFKFQPMRLIRDYFGEYYAFYFAWVGVFVSTLWVPVIIGIIIFCIGLHESLVQAQTANLTTTTNSTVDLSSTVSYYTAVFTGSFDNHYTPFFGLVICLWGAFFMEIWKRENSRLAYEWDVENFESHEVNLAEYERRRAKHERERENWSSFAKAVYEYESYFKYAVSTTVLLFMICLVGLDIALVVVLRLFLKKKMVEYNSSVNFIVVDVGSVVINSIFIMVLNVTYTHIATKLTKWENHRTKTEYDDAIITKLFAFQFVNNYGSLYYLAFFRNIEFDNGIFNLGHEYQDLCTHNNCMPLLTVQMLTILLLKPLPRFLTTIIIPIFTEIYKKYRMKRDTVRPVTDQPNSDESRSNAFNEELVLLNLRAEKVKSDFPNENIADEYTEKVILFGYLILFACSFSLAPLIVLVINLIDIRVDAQRILWLFKRPVGYRAQDIGSWFVICRLINVIGIITNSFLVAFTSNWSRTFLQNSTEIRLMFVVAFEHVVFFLWLCIIYILPDISKEVKIKMKEEDEYVKDVMSTGKAMQHEAGNRLLRRMRSRNASVCIDTIAPVGETRDKVPVLNVIIPIEDMDSE